MNYLDKYEVDLKELSSSDVYRSNELSYIRYEELVVGPDVTLVDANVNGKSDWLLNIDI